MHGPIDYIAVKFPGNNFKGEILNELDEAVQDGTIAVLDISVITKDADGNMQSLEASNFYEMLAPEATETRTGGLIKPEDLEEIGELLEPNSSAGLLIIEQTWARGLKQAILNADGELLAEGRIHPEATAEINDEMEE